MISEAARNARRWALGASLLLVGSCCAGIVLVWQGHHSRRLTFDAAVRELRGAYPQSAAERVRVQIMHAVAELQWLADQPGRDGLVARNVLAHVEKASRR